MDSNNEYQDVATAGDAIASPRYAGLIIRFFASLIDGIVFIVLMLIPILVMAYLITDKSVSRSNSLIILIIFVLIVFVCAWLYDAGFESSRYMATPGKMVCGLLVTDMEGRRISFGRATVRYFCKSVITSIISNFINNCLASIYGLADVLTMFTNDRKQCIHDMVAGTVVIEGRARPTANDDTAYR